MEAEEDLEKALARSNKKYIQLWLCVILYTFLAKGLTVDWAELKCDYGKF